MARRAQTPETVRVVSAPGLLFDPVDTTPDDAAALVATGSFVYAEAPADVTAQEETDEPG